MADKGIIIIKKVKKVQGHAHHGGSWKVAYADFVTAMMAFFLLLWLLNVTTDEQKKGIADYFTPSNLSRSMSGAGGMLGGRTMTKDGSRISDTGTAAVVVGLAPTPEAETRSFDPREAEAARRAGEREQEAFRQAEAALRQALQQTPDEAELSKHILVDMTPEGMRIQLVDKENESMFATGSAVLNERARKLLLMVAVTVARLPNKVSITGHTDARPYRREGGYGNWELSADRSNASRRTLIEAGVPAEQVEYVTGKADRELLIGNDPLNASNRRIAIVMLRQAPVVAPSAAAPAAR
jgi:chemotaxis protein MotB